MPRIIPIRDLRNTSEISNMVHATQEPIFVTKNGCATFVTLYVLTYSHQGDFNYETRFIKRS